MDFSLTDEQAMLRESIEQFVSKTYSFDERRRHSAQKNGFSPEVWQQFAELGWLAIPFSENDGGFDGGPIELMLIMQEFGKGLVVEPYLASIVLAGGAIRRCDNADLKKRLLPGLIEGQLQAALAFAEAGAGYELDNITTTAEETTDGYRISGEKIAVLNAAAADCILVSAITAADGVCLFCLPADAPGVSCRAYPTVDGLHAADLTLKNVPVDADRLLTSKDGGINLLQATIDDATLAVCAEAVGIMQMLN
ncbi:MAG: acyl-CoA/acyl-ACP dehydrogenase, partial [Gammaproteobacteria bacterium]|nr:acyl-CoA/acyl-ACP dehydrogenase [Gammaproteobacteria bacterium]